MRNVWNLRPAHFDTPATKIELIHAKSSDFAAYGPRAVDFDPETFSYRLDPTFDHEMWQYELDRARNRPNGMTATKKEDVFEKLVVETLAKVLKFIEPKGHIYLEQLHEWFSSQGIGANVRSRVLRALPDTGRIERIIEHRTSKAIYGTHDAIRRLQALAPIGTYRS